MSAHNTTQMTNILMQNLRKDLAKLDGCDDSDDDETDAPPPVVPSTVEPGLIAEVRGLKSAGGKKLNGRRCVVIRFVEDEGRFQVRMENESSRDATFAIKEDNLHPLPKLPLPTSNHRGNASKIDDTAPAKLCELLLYFKGCGPDNPRGDFRPSSIMLDGYAASCLSRLNDQNFMYFVPTQMEQMAGVLALASICRDDEEQGAARVLFALLEGDPMYVDVFIQTMHWTGLIVRDEYDRQHNDVHAVFSDCPPTKLTPDQDYQPYVRCMASGPVLLLKEFMQYEFGEALWAAMRKSEFYHLFIQRLLRWTAREALKTSDGQKLGPQARKILCKVVPGVNISDRMSPSAADALLELTPRISPYISIDAKLINRLLADAETSAK